MDQDERNAAELEITALGHPVARVYTPGKFTRWRQSWPGRLAISALCVALIVGAMAALLSREGAGIGNGWEGALGFPTVTPSGPIPPGGDSFIIVDTVPWGALTADGQRPALSDQYDLGGGFTLPRGAHRLTYQARFFPTLHCVVSVPQSNTDTCPLAVETDLGGATFQRFLDLRAIPANLESAQLSALNTAITGEMDSLAASATIKPGDRYINQHGAPAIARGPLTFTVRVAGDPPLLACPRACVDPTRSASPANVWYLNENAHPTWNVEDASGNGFESPATLGLNTENTLQFDVMLSGSRWIVSLDHPQAALDSIVQSAALAAAMSLENSATSDPGQGAGLGVTSAANPADGSIIIFPGAAGATHDELLL